MRKARVLRANVPSSTAISIVPQCVFLSSSCSLRLNQRTLRTSTIISQSHLGVTYIPGNKQIKDASSEKPLIILLGWLGCQPKYMDKYAHLYRDKGYDTLSFIPPIATIISPSSTKRYVLELLDKSHQLQQEQEEKKKEQQKRDRLRPVVFHTFSNNGFHFFTHLLLEAPHKQQHQSVIDSTIGCIIDSAPSEISHEIFTRGFVGTAMGLLGMNSNKGGLPEYHHWLLTPLIGLFFSIYLRLPHVHRNLERVFSVLSNQSVWCPQLFLYSKGDTLIPHTHIEHIINAQKEVGLPVYTKCWNDSPHVGHYRMHPAEYTQAILDFIDNVTKLHQKQVEENRPTLLDKNVTQEKLQQWRSRWRSLIKI